MAYTEEFFIHIEGEEKGPYTFPQLKRLYEKNLIPEETLYWCDGMEQLEPVSELCGKRKANHLRHLRQVRVSAVLMLGACIIMAVLWGPMLKDGWREMNDRDRTPEGAYWRARGFLREEVKRRDESVAFEGYKAGSVTFDGTGATVILPGTVFGKDNAGKPTTWKVELVYDAGKNEWRLR